MDKAIRLNHVKLQFLEAENNKFEQFQVVQHNTMTYLISLLLMSLSLSFAACVSLNKCLLAHAWIYFGKFLGVVALERYVFLWTRCDSTFLQEGAGLGTF